MSVSLKAAHVPTVIRPFLAAVTDANAAHNALHRQISVAPMDARPALQVQYEEAAEAGKAALAALVAATIENAPAMRAAAANAFASAVERARGHIAAAEAELRDAAEAAGLFAQIRDGKPTINASSERANRSKARGACMRAAGALHNLEMPEGIDA